MPLLYHPRVAEAQDVRWEPPGPGGWWLELGHFPRPLSRLYAGLFGPVTEGWARGAARYGQARGSSRTAVVNGWLYFGSDLEPRTDAPGDDEAEVARARAERRWRDEVRRWFEEERPAVVAANLALQDEDVRSLADPDLRGHVARAIDNYRTFGPLHFEHHGRNVVNAVLREEAAAAGVATLDLHGLLAGSSPASRRPAELVAAVADALRAAGVPRITSVGDIRAVPAAADALETYLGEYGHRLVETYDLISPTLAEQPALIVRSVQAALDGSWRAAASAPPVPPWRDGSVDVAPEVAARLDELLADACEAHAVRDDDDGLCFFWTLGLVRRAVLEAGRRLEERGRVREATDLFDAEADELLAVLDGHAAPTAEELANRAAARVASGTLVPPPSLHEAAPEPVADDGDGTVRGLGIGRGRATGRAVVHRSGDDALQRIEPGDVLVAVTTTPAFNTVVPLLAAIVTQEGGEGSHAALVARELGVPAVVGVARALEVIADGDTVEVDAVTGTVRSSGTPRS